MEIKKATILEICVIDEEFSINLNMYLQFKTATSLFEMFATMGDVTMHFRVITDSACFSIVLTQIGKP